MIKIVERYNDSLLFICELFIVSNCDIDKILKLFLFDHIITNDSKESW